MNLVQAGTSCSRNSTLRLKLSYMHLRAWLSVEMQTSIKNTKDDEDIIFINILQFPPRGSRWLDNCFHYLLLERRAERQSLGGCRTSGGVTVEEDCSVGAPRIGRRKDQFLRKVLPDFISTSYDLSRGRMPVMIPFSSQDLEIGFWTRTFWLTERGWREVPCWFSRCSINFLRWSAPALALEMSKSLAPGRWGSLPQRRRPKNNCAGDFPDTLHCKWLHPSCNRSVLKSCS